MKSHARRACFILAVSLLGSWTSALGGPLKVYVLAGQSNMEGHARVETFDYLGDDPATAPLLREMRGTDGGFRVCENVWISYLTGRGDENGEGFGRLTAGYGSRSNPAESGGKIGPEFTFGICLDKAIEEPILIIKTAWGGKSLHTDFRSPGAGPYLFSDEEIGRHEQRGHDVAQVRADKAAATGRYYRLMIDHVKHVLGDISRVYPEYEEEEGFEVAGFIWFQAWNDMVDGGVYPDRANPGGYDEYSECLSHFIRDVRRDLFAPDMHFVIGVIGVGGPLEGYENERNRAVHANFRAAMAAPASLPQFSGNVTAVQTAPYWDAPLAKIDAKRDTVRQMAHYLRSKHPNHANKDGAMSEAEQKKYVEEYKAGLISPEEEATWKRGASNAGYHYLGCAKTMALIGWAFAEAMLEAQATAAPPSTTAGPDFTRGAQIPEAATHDWNLGPTGARGWMYSNKMETSEARQVYVTEVDKASPADGVFRPGDVILGIDDRPFAFDPRTELGKAIGAAEATDGALSLIRWREGEMTTAVVQLPVLGDYGPTAPFDCPKSKRIFDLGCEALARKMRASPDEGNPIERSLNALALLSSGRPEYLPLIRRQVEWASHYSDLERRSLHSWWYGPVNILLAEYVLATGDRSFMADLERITMEIVRGQSEVGSWGHRFVQPNGRLAGYGMMNAPGLPLTVSLILAREAGVDDPELDEAIEKSARLIRFYVGKGSVPYGDHHPWIETHDDNGKNGIAALMFHLLDDVDAAEYFSRMSVASHGGERDTGHTGNFFNMLWAMPGVALSGPHATGAWMKEYGWHYDLARRWDGTYLHQGPPAAKPDSYSGWDCTGAYLLAYAQPLETLHLAGRKKSVAEQIDAITAKSLIADGRGWSPRLKLAAYATRTDAQILSGLRSWSPVVRERSAMELARREGDPTPQLIAMLDEADLDSRLGACQALIMLEDRAAPAVPALQETLRADDLWLRIKAAEALASIGRQAMPALPDLLTMLAEHDVETDPRGMQQRYLCFALFNRRGGMLAGSLDGVDRRLLYAAVRAGLRNEDGRARGSVGSVYERLSYEEIEPLLPSIHQAALEPAPSGIMFADGIRLTGLEILARHRIEEGLPLCVELIDVDRWGLGNRIKRCLATLRLYGGAARSEIPRLRQLERDLAAKRWKPDAIAELRIPALIQEIEADEEAPVLRSLGASAQHSTTAGDQAAPISPFIAAPQISEYVREVFQDRDGDYWFGTNGDGVCRYDGTSLTYLSVEEGFGGRAVRGILQDEGGAMWFATNAGVSRYESGAFTNYTVANGLSDDQVWSIMRDSTGTIWVGTHGGVCRFDGTSFVPFPLPRVAVENPESRFTPNVVFAMFEDQAGNLWFGTDGEGAHRYDGESFTSYTTKEGLAGNLVRSIRGDRRGRIWIGSDGGGVSRYDGSAFRTVTTEDGLSNDRVFEILEDRAGNMWFSTLGAGACRYDGTSFTAFREDQSLMINGRPARGHVQEFFEDKDGVLWLGCSGGLFRFDGTSFVNVTRNGPWPVPAQESTPAKVADPTPGG